MPQTIADYLRRVAAERMELAKKGQALGRSARPEPETPEPDTELDELAQEKYLLARGREYWPHWKNMDRNDPVNAKRRQEAYEAAKEDLAKKAGAQDRIRVRDKVEMKNGQRWEYMQLKRDEDHIAASLNVFAKAGWSLTALAEGTQLGSFIIILRRRKA